MTAALEAAVVDAGLVDLEARLRVVEACVRDAVARRRAVDPDPDDRFRGLYIPDATVDRLLDGPRPLLDPGVTPDIRSAVLALEAEAEAAERAGQDVRARRLVRAFGLDAADLDILLVALAPDLDPRFERLYAYLQDDVSRRRASTGLALELATGRAGPSAARSRLDAGAPLVAGGLLLVEEAERPFLTRSLRVPDRVAAHLLGDDHLDARLAQLRVTPTAMGSAEGRAIARALDDGSGLVYIRERLGAAGMALAVAALAVRGDRILALDLGRLAGTEDAREIAAVAERECRLTGATLLAGPIDALAERGAATVRAFGELACPAILVGGRTWDPAWSRSVPVLVEAPLPSLADRAAVWAAELGSDAQVGASTGDDAMVDASSTGSGQVSLDAGALTIQFRLGPDQIMRAARAARQQAVAEDRPMAPDDLRAGARAQNAAGLERLARRIRPSVDWRDLVLPRDIVEQLRELAARARFRDVVLDAWGMGRAGSSRGRGLAALFAGDSGTGKTMSAEVMAAELGLDLYVIDLSTVIDKYVGETEKNLDRIFSEADRVNGVLLFDEADAVFGKRSDVRDSHDRYANVEVAYLLQRMEQFDGVAILTTNLRSNLDEAFTRRLDAVVDFPVPEEEDRLRLWERHLPPGVPRGGDLDLGFLARRFRLSGGNIRNVSLAAAYLAAAADRRLRMEDLILGMATEYRKLGRLCVEAEFGRYHPLVAGSS